MIKYIKSVLWRIAKCLSYIEEARCLKVKRTMCKSSVRLSSRCTYCILNFLLLLFAMTRVSESFTHKGASHKATILGLHYIIFTFSQKLQRLDCLQWRDTSSELHKNLLFHLRLSRRWRFVLRSSRFLHRVVSVYVSGEHRRVDWRFLYVPSWRICQSASPKSILLPG